MLEREKIKRAFLFFFSFSFFSYLIILYWIPGIMARYGNMGRALSLTGLVVLAAFLSLFTGLAGILIRKVLSSAATDVPSPVLKNTPKTVAKRLIKSFLGGSGGRFFKKAPLAAGGKNAAIFLIPFIWVAKDLIVEHVLSGFPWCITGYSQHNNLFFIQAAEFGGVHLITFLVIYLNILFYLLLRDRERRGRVLLAILISFFSIYTIGYSLYRNAEFKTAPLPIHKAGIIQPNAGNNVMYSSEVRRRLDRLFAQSKELAGKGAEFVVWPEYTVPILPMQTPFYFKKFKDFVTGHVPIIAGFNDFKGKDEFYNTAFLFKKDKVERYYKVHLTPFGEYVPLRKMLFFVKNITNEIGDYTFGKSVFNVEIDGHSVSLPICYEVIFPQLIRDFTAKGSELMVTISNDLWEGDTAGPRQILSMALFRSVENRRYMLRSTSTGISALVTPTGRITHRSKWGVEDAFIAEFKYIKGKTLFVRFGYLFPYFCLFVVLLYVLRLLWAIFTTKPRGAGSL
ncbi:MAG: apolipoprotein N-acyltransferase [Candidatus Aminicenantes bacterium]|nr:apolipoprotein N-acyltransferase [Candidatus Aminicenantes bacterium]